MPGSTQRNPMWVLLFYTILMVTLPITAFFVSKNIAESVFDISSNQSYMYAVAVSVIIIHIILGLFVYQAYNDDSKAYPEKED